MDRFSQQAGDHTYDSDAEADDEFERSQMTSPMSHEDEDDLSDRSYDPEDDQDSLDGGETPTTQGWNDREIRSPVGSVSTWSEEEVADYISSLSPALKQYRQSCIDEGITGDILIALHHEELRELGVTSVGHRLTILKAVYEQKIRSGIKIAEGDYVPLSAEGEKGEMTATQDDIARIIESIRLRDQRIIAAEAEMRAMKQDLDRISEENRKLREETLPVMRLVKDQRTPLPDPSSGTIPSPRGEIDPANKATGLSRKFSTKKLFLGSAPKQPSPTHPPHSYVNQPREVRDDGGAHLEASAAATAASNHLTASMQSQPSPNSVHGQLSPTSPAYSVQGPSSGSSYHPPASASTTRSFRDGSSSARYDQRSFKHEDTGTGYSSQTHWSQASTIVADQPLSAHAQDRSRRQAPTPSPRDNDPSGSRDNKDVRRIEIYKSFRVSIDDPCRVVLPVALKRYNIIDDWHQYALYIVHGDQERCLGLEEKPLMLFKQLDKEGRKPMFMLRRHAAPQEGWSGTIQNHDMIRQIPGGVL